MLKRSLSDCFDDLATAGTSGEAESYLERHPVSHLISDMNLGPDEPDGFEIVTRLRPRHPGIQRAVVFTGGVLPKTHPSEVDRVIQKSGDLDELRRALGIGKT